MFLLLYVQTLSRYQQKIDEIPLINQLTGCIWVPFFVTLNTETLLAGGTKTASFGLVREAHVTTAGGWAVLEFTLFCETVGVHGLLNFVPTVLEDVP